jgi:hypothetical protein
VEENPSEMSFTISLAAETMLKTREESGVGRPLGTGVMVGVCPAEMAAANVDSAAD